MVLRLVGSQATWSRCLFCILKRLALAVQELPSSAPGDETICPEATANIFSTVTFSWVSGLMKKGYK